MTKFEVEMYTLMILNLEDEIDLLKERLTHVERERDEYFHQVQSYEAWMNRSIERLKELQK
jgi:hypothetical protein